MRVSSNVFKQAASAGLTDTLPGADYYLVDALHMLGIAAPPDEQLDWNLRALAAAEASTDARARGWRGSLLNNIGGTYHDRGDYAKALDYWQQGLTEREASGDKARARIAKWKVARGLRSLNRLDEAEKIQRELGWKPTIGFAEGLKDTIRWYQDNQAWVNTIRTGDYLKYYETQYGSRLAS